MNLRKIGIFILLFSFLMGSVVFMYHQTIHELIDELRVDDCPENDIIDLHTNIHTNISYFFASIIFLIGLYLIIFGKNLHITLNKTDSDFKMGQKLSDDILTRLTDNERLIFETILKNDGTILQSELGVKTGLSKVNITRTIEKLENKKLITKQRYGMTNLIMLERRGNKEKDMQ